MTLYEKYSPADRAVIRQWQIGVIACYSGVVLILLTLVFASPTVSGWIASAAQAEMSMPQPKSQSATDWARLGSPTY